MSEPDSQTAVPVRILIAEDDAEMRELLSACSARRASGC